MNFEGQSTIHSWRELQGNKYNRTPTRELLEGKIVRVADVRVKGESKSPTARRTLKAIVYDNDYLLAWLNNICAKTQLTPEELIALLVQVKQLQGLHSDET